MQKLGHIGQAYFFVEVVVHIVLRLFHQRMALNLPGTAAVLPEKAHQGGKIILCPSHQALQFPYVPEGLYLHDIGVAQRKSRLGVHAAPDSRPTGQHHGGDAYFASRSQDLFYLPNTALTYGGAAGVWYGLAANLGGAMSLPEYELIMDVQPINSPADTEHGIEKPLGIYLDSGRASNNAGFAVSTACDEEKLIRVLNAFDYFYTEEGSCVRTMGLTSEEGAAECQDYIEKGITNGTREPNSRKWTAEMEKNTEGVTAFASDRMPGVKVDYPARESDLIDGIYYTDVGHEAWTKYGNANVFPLSVTFTPEETSEINTINTNMQDYANGKIANFIMGRDELTPDTFAAYQQQLKDLGLERYLELRQAGYDRYLARSK